MAMRRMLASLVGLALMAAPGAVSPFHIHAYTEHDHPEHHHGPALHEHHHPQATLQHDGDHDPLRLESCDPGQHAVSLVMACASPPHLPIVVAERADPSRVEPSVTPTLNRLIVDIRVHGPPARGRIPPRAPPADVPA